MNHFEIFGLPARYPLQLSDLEKRHRELALQLHPDRVGKADARARLEALERTTALNEAFRVLKDPVRRAFYLLRLSGVDLEAQGGQAAKDLPLEYLEEVMELREALAQAKSSKDLPSARALAGKVEALQSAALAAAVEGLEVLGRSPGDDAALRKASHQLGRVRYFTRFLEEAESFEEEML